MITTTVGNISYHTPAERLGAVVGKRDRLLHCTFGRMNPPTSAHIELIGHMENEMMMGDDSRVVVYLSNTQNMKNPLPVEQRIELLEDMFIDAVFRPVSNLFEAMDKANYFAEIMGADGIVWWTGTDRLADVQRLWLYPDRWQTPVLRIVELKRNVDDTRSATALRAAALNSDYETFEKLCGVHQDRIPQLFDEVRSLLTNGSLESKTKTAK